MIDPSTPAHALRDALVVVASEHRAALPTPVREVLDALEAREHADAEEAKTRREALEVDAAERAERREHNRAMIAKYGPALAKRFRAASRHLTTYEMGGTCTTKAIEVEHLVEVHLGLDSRHSMYLDARAHVPDEAKVEAECRRLRLKRSRLHGTFGPLTGLDVKLARNWLDDAREHLAKIQAEKVRESAKRGSIRQYHGLDSQIVDTENRIEDLTKAIEVGSLAEAAYDIEMDSASHIAKESDT